MQISNIRVPDSILHAIGISVGLSSLFAVYKFYKNRQKNIIYIPGSMVVEMQDDLTEEGYLNASSSIEEGTMVTPFVIVYGDAAKIREIVSNMAMRKCQISINSC